MSTSARKQSILALAAAAAALASAAQAFANEDDQPEAKPEPVKPVKAAPKPEPVKAAEPVKAPEPVKAAVPAAPPPAHTNGGGGDLQAQCRKAAKAYAEVYGREGLKEVLKKYTEGTLADAPVEKLPDLLKDLS